MSRLDLRRLEVWSALACQGGVWRATVATLAPGAPDVTATATLDGRDSLTFALPAADPAMAWIGPRAVIRVVTDDGAGGETWEEWRLATVDYTNAPDGAVVTVGCVGILLDLADAGALEDVSLPVPMLTGGMAQATVGLFWGDVVAPFLAANGYTGFSLGTVEATAVYDWSWNGETALEVLRAGLAKGGFVGELRVRRNGTTGYWVDVLTAIGSDIPTTTLTVDDTLRRAERGYETARQATRVAVVGKDGTTVDQNFWRIIAEDSTTKQIAAAEPAGITWPTVRPNQLTGLAVRRLTTGRCVGITGSSSGYPTLGWSTLNLDPAQWPGAPWSDHAAVEIVETPTDDSVWSADTRLALPPTVPNASVPGSPFNAKGLDYLCGTPSGSAVTLALDTTHVHRYSTGADTSFNAAVDGPYDPVDLRAEVWRQVGSTVLVTNNPTYGAGAGDQTALVFVAGATWKLVRTYESSPGVTVTADVALPAGTVAGDVLCLVDGTHPDVLMFELATLDGSRVVFTPTHLLPDGVHLPATAGNWAGDVVNELRVYRRQTTYPRVEAYVGGTSTLFLSDTSGIVAGDRLVFHRAPEPARYLGRLIDYDAEVTQGYGVKGGTVTASDITGTLNILNNGAWRTFPTGSPVPPGFFTSGSLTLTRTTAPDDVPQGTAATAITGTAAGSAILTSQVCRYWRRASTPYVALRVPYRITNATTGVTITLTVQDATRRTRAPAGGVPSTRYTTLGQYTVPADKTAYGAWGAAVLEGIAVPASCRDYRVQIEVAFSSAAAAAGARCVLSGCALTVGATAPSALIDNSGSNQLWAQGMTALLTNADPKAASSSYRVEFHDFYRENPSVFAAKRVDVGQTVTVTDAALGVASQALRVMEYTRRWRQGRCDESAATLARVPPTASRALAESSA
jgi:hypothetical protein